MSGFTLREAGVEDVADVRRLVRALAEYERLLDRFTASEADYVRSLSGPNPLARATLAEVNGTAVGVALWYFRFTSFSARSILWLEDIFVEPACRRLGIGLGFFRHLARIARDQGCLSVGWSVLGWNRPAIEFYHRIGAEPVSDWIGYKLAAEAISALAAS